jgi:hypothetical protein
MAMLGGSLRSSWPRTVEAQAVRSDDEDPGTEVAVDAVIELTPYPN